MNELQALLNQFKQGLTQIVFQSHKELKGLVSEEDAASFVVDELESLTKTFSKKKDSGSLFSTVESLEQVWNKKLSKANEEKKYDEILYAEDVLKAIKLIKFLPKENESAY